MNTTTPPTSPRGFSFTSLIKKFATPDFFFIAEAVAGKVTFVAWVMAHNPLN
jgi:hypothetical protein